MHISYYNIGNGTPMIYQQQLLPNPFAFILDQIIESLRA